MKNETISHELKFGWKWDNIEAVIEYLEAMPDQGTTLIGITAKQLKEGAIEAFGRLFAQRPLYRFIPEATEVNVYGVTAFYHASQITDSIHEPISRWLQLHPDSDTSITHIAVTFTMRLQWRLTGPLVRYDYDAIKAKYLL